MQGLGYLIGATMLAEAHHCCDGLEGISERLHVCLKLAAACGEYLKLLEKALPLCWAVGLGGSDCQGNTRAG